MADIEPIRDRSRAARAPRPVGIARHGRLKKRRGWTTALGVIASTLAVVLVAGIATGGIYYVQMQGKLDAASVDINDGAEAPIPTIGAYEGGFNLLIVGTDEAAGREATLNDVNILVHVAADQQSAVAVSIPRDMVVPIPRCVNEETGRKSSAASGLPINNAWGLGGLKCVVDTVSEFTGLDVQFAGKINFTGVVEMSTAVGGVTVCVDKPINDKKSGLIMHAGENTLEGVWALAFLRTRHGVGDGSDLTRISSQQVFMSALVRKLKAEDTLTNPGKLLSLANAAVDNMTLSKELSRPTTMVSMAQALAKIPMDRITFVQYPGTTGQGGIFQGKVAPIKTAGAQLMDAIRADKPIGVEQPGDGRGSELNPNATPLPTDPAATADPNATGTPDPVATDGSAPPVSDVVVIPGVRGQTAADQTCSVAN